MLSCKMNMGFEVPYTLIPNTFIDRYMSAANPVFALVYIALYRHCAAGSQGVTLKTVAESLNILESDALNALKYWQEEGLLSFSMDEQGLALAVDFLPIAAGEQRAAAAIPMEADMQDAEEQADAMAIEPEEAEAADKEGIVPMEQEPEDMPQTTAAVRPIMEARPVYAPEELDMYRQASEDIKKLFASAEQTLGKLLTYNDMNVLFSLYDWLGLPVPVIEELLAVCAEKGHRNMRYIEKAALDWAENSINTVEAAKAYVARFTHDYYQILKAFGYSHRDPTPTEIKHMKKWLDVYAMPLDLVLEACDKTVLQTGGAKLAYTDKILKEWHAKGVQTIDEVMAMEAKFYADKEAQGEKNALKQAPKPPKAVQRQNRFVNCPQRNWDDELLKKLETQYLVDIKKN